MHGIVQPVMFRIPRKHLSGPYTAPDWVVRGNLFQGAGNGGSDRRQTTFYRRKTGHWSSC
jgi:hypothetical protein